MIESTKQIDIADSMLLQYLKLVCEAPVLNIKNCVNLREIHADNITYLQLDHVYSRGLQCIQLRSLETASIEDCAFVHLDLRSCKRLKTICCSNTPLQTILLPMVALEKISISYAELRSFIHPLPCNSIYLRHTCLREIIVCPISDFELDTFSNCRLLSIAHCRDVVIKSGQIGSLELIMVERAYCNNVNITCANLSSMRIFRQHNPNNRMKIIANDNMRVITPPIRSCIGPVELELSGWWVRRMIMKVSPSAHILAHKSVLAINVGWANSRRIMGMRRIISGYN